MGYFIKKEELNATLEKLRREHKKIVVTNGCFDILHVGHVKYLEKSKSYGDILIVLLNSDVSVKKIKGDNRPINCEEDRAYILCALSCVNYVMPFDEATPANLLDIIKPDIYTKGADYTKETLPETNVILKNGGEIKFIDFVDGKSTTSIIEKMNK